MTSPTLDLRMLADPALRADPYPLLRELREVSPLVLADGWLVVAARHAECAAALREPTASSERFRSVLAPPGVKRGGLSFLVLDPPDRTRLRRLVSAAFTPRVVAGLRPRIGEIVDRLLMRVAEQGRTDVVADLAYPLPVQIISELLGVPAEDHERFRGWSAELARALDPQFADPDPARMAAGVAAREEFERYFSGLIAVRRDRPARDLLSLLIQAESEGDKLTEEELLATCVLLLVAGHETTANLIANAILALLRHPDQLDLLRARPELVDNCVEETLRYDAPVQMTTRAARGVLPVGPAGTWPSRPGRTSASARAWLAWSRPWRWTRSPAGCGTRGCWSPRWSTRQTSTCADRRVSMSASRRSHRPVDAGRPPGIVRVRAMDTRRRGHDEHEELVGYEHVAAHVRRLRQRARANRLAESLLFLPVLLLVGAVLVEQVLAVVDRTVTVPSTPFDLSASAAEALLATIAGATITTAGVVFSLLVVSLQLASGQFSPRVLRTFWRDR